MTISGRTRVFALLGDPVAHSLSPAMHNAAFAALGLDAVYVPMRCGADQVPVLMRALVAGGGGGNVTVPHKQVAASAVDEAIGPGRDAVNTFWGVDGRLIGDNTDVTGVLAGLDAIGAPPTSWLVLGTGGGAHSVVAAARDRSARLAFQSRDPDRAAVMSRFAAERGVEPAERGGCEVVINTTPVGLAPDDPLPSSPAGPSTTRFVLDLVYAPGETRWVREFRASGARAADGRIVLVAQGAAAFERWFPGIKAPREVIRAAVRACLG
jgi:shikimate dehydrogenase